jgi:hypothetical protein
MNLLELEAAVNAAKRQAAAAGIPTDRVGVFASLDQPAVSSNPLRLSIDTVEVNDYVDPGEKNLEVLIIAKTAFSTLNTQE